MSKIVQKNRGNKICWLEAPIWASNENKICCFSSNSYFTHAKIKVTPSCSKRKRDKTLTWQVLTQRVVPSKISQAGYYRICFYQDRPRSYWKSKFVRLLEFYHWIEGYKRAKSVMEERFWEATWHNQEKQSEIKKQPINNLNTVDFWFRQHQPNLWDNWEANIRC